MNYGPPPVSPSGLSRNGIEQTTPRPQSSQSNRSATSLQSDIVAANVLFKDRARRPLFIDITKPGQRVLAALSDIAFKMTHQPIDRMSQELIVTALRDQAPEPQICLLGDDEFNDSWDMVVTYIQENRHTKKPEFLLELG